MKKVFFLLLIFCWPLALLAQLAWNASVLPESDSYKTEYSPPPFKKKLFQNNRGAIVGLQRGVVTAIEMGAEAHWRKLSLSNSRIIGATANLGYNFAKHIIGYRAGMWMKHGRVNLTYGGSLIYYSNFKGLNSYGAGPAVGFRLAGFHLINGYNFLAGDKGLEGANTLYITLRYYFPVENKFTWDRKTMKKKKEKGGRKKKEKKIGKKKKKMERRIPYGKNYIYLHKYNFCRLFRAIAIMLVAFFLLYKNQGQLNERKKHLDHWPFYQAIG